MSMQVVTEQIRWQDLKVRSEIDIVLEIARKEGWKDCEVFGYGDMITEPRESMGWDLIPADVYEHSIPPVAVRRLQQIIHAGIRVQGVIIADDQRKLQPAPIPAPAPARPRFSLPSLKPTLSRMGKAMNRIFHSAGAVASSFGNALSGFIRAFVSLIGKVLLGLVSVVCVAALVGLAGYMLIHHFWLALPVGFLLLTCIGSSTSTGTGSDRRFKYDPILVILVDDGNGHTVWVSLFTWYD